MAQQSWFERNAPARPQTPPTAPTAPVSSGWFERNSPEAVRAQDPARALRGATAIGAGTSDPNYQFPAGVKQGVGRFATEALRGAGLHPSDLPDLFDQAVSNPALALDIISGLAEGSNDQLRKAWEAFKENRPADSLGHLTYAAVPGVGPALQQYTEEFTSGDTAGASGRFLGTAARQDIPVDLATASGNRAVRSWQEGMEFTPGGMLVEAAKRPPRVQALRQSAQRLADDVSPTPVSPEAWGTTARDRVTQAREGYTAIADEAYSAFRAATEKSGQLVDISKVLASGPMQKLWQQLEKKRAATGGLVGRELRAYLKISDLRDLPPGLADIAVIDDILGDMKAYARTERGPIKLIVMRSWTRCQMSP